MECAPRDATPSTAEQRLDVRPRVPHLRAMGFFDTEEAVGENVMSALPEYDFGGPPTWISSNWGGLIFDTGFTA